MNEAARRGGLCLLAVLCLIASVALSALLLVSENVTDTPGGSHDIVTPAPDRAPLAAASNGQPTNHSQDRHSPGRQQPAGLGESEDGPAKKLFLGFTALSPAFEVWTEDAGWKPASVVTEVRSDDFPPQLLQRPPPTG